MIWHTLGIEPRPRNSHPTLMVELHEDFLLILLVSNLFTFLFLCFLCVQDWSTISAPCAGGRHEVGTRAGGVHATPPVQFGLQKLGRVIIVYENKGDDSCASY